MFDDLIDYCVSCGAEHGYMSGPCDKCNGKVFSHDKPEVEHWLDDKEIAELEREKPIPYGNTTFERGNKYYACEFSLTRDGVEKLVYGPFNTEWEAMDADTHNY